MSGVPQPALEHLGAFVDGFVIQLCLGSPTPAQIGKLIAGAARQIPGGRLRTLDRYRLIRAIANRRPSGEDALSERPGNAA